MSNNNLKVWIGVVTALLPLASGAPVFAAAKTLNDYCVTPPFIAQQIPPQALENAPRARLTSRFLE